VALERVELPECWRGEKRLWFLSKGAKPVDDAGKPVDGVMVRGVVGTCYQNQCYCVHYKRFINPNGFTCQQCHARRWPAVEDWRTHRLPWMVVHMKPEDIAADLIEAVNCKKLTEAEATSLTKEFSLERRAE